MNLMPGGMTDSKESTTITLTVNTRNSHTQKWEIFLKKEGVSD